LKRGEGLWNYVQRGVSQKYPKFGKLSESQLRRLAKQHIPELSGIQKLRKAAQRYKAEMAKRNPLTPEIVDEAHRKDREARAFLAIISIMDGMDRLHPDSLGRVVSLVNWYAEHKKVEKYPA
jgi:hypothetical protein